MRRLLIILITIFISLLLNGQEIDTTFFDSKWKITSKDDYSYYRITVKNQDGLFECKDYWKDGQLQMKGQYSSLNPEVREGEFIWYHKNGNVRQKVIHKNNLVCGKIYHYDQNGDLDFSYCLNVDSLDNVKEFKKSIKKFRKFAEKELQYPENARLKSIEGQVMTTFYISPDGQLEKFRILKGVDQEINKEAERVVKLFNGWIIPIYKSEKTYVATSLPVNFKLK